MLPISVLIRNRPKPFEVDTEMTVEEASIYLRKHRIGGAPVTRDGKLVGFASERDFVYRVIAQRKDPRTMKVAEIMSSPVETATMDDSVEACEVKMRKAHVRHLPVLDGEKLIACISLRDVLKTELRQVEHEVHDLCEYIHGATAEGTGFYGATGEGSR